MTFAPAIGGQLANALYGAVADAHRMAADVSRSHGHEEGALTCYGVSCFRDTFFVAFAVTLVAFLVLAVALVVKESRHEDRTGLRGQGRRSRGRGSQAYARLPSS